MIAMPIVVSRASHVVARPCESRSTCELAEEWLAIHRKPCGWSPVIFCHSCFFCSLMSRCRCLMGVCITPPRAAIFNVSPFLAGPLSILAQACPPTRKSD